MIARDDGVKFAFCVKPVDSVNDAASRDPVLPDRAAALVRARERWPGLSVCGELTPGPGERDDAASCGAVDRAAEWYLTRACAAGDRVAIQAFEAEFFAEVRACHARMRPHRLGLDELEQRIREKLFVKNAISRFSGKGDLRRWLRVLTTRMILDHVRSVQPEVPLEDQLMAGLLENGADATLAKAQLRVEIRGALHEAFAVLTDRQKLLLRSEVRGTPLSALAATYHVHVRSIQRWAREAHDVFLAEFRGTLARRLRVSPGELSSVLTFARSQLLSGLADLARESASSAASDG
jgi:RNA polymerase sigma-70 factor, ECF subfamily